MTWTVFPKPAVEVSKVDLIEEKGQYPFHLPIYNSGPSYTRGGAS